MLRRYGVSVALLTGVVAGCSQPPYQLPDRTTQAVQAEERQIAARLPAMLFQGPGRCQVRFLGREGSSAFVWAVCASAPTAGVPSEGLSMPLRLDEDQVVKPADGAGYADSVKRMLPPGLSDLVLREHDKLRP
ncbi:hypothetical protein [Actinopolymorpha alba]|uniref:hypothetical protein n=1 Tax=Actinopolymorpha alba TaxID=533267 RepID=UPI0012F6C6A2|nr:hypothetical protein [Actinopolymorpha alba]